MIISLAVILVILAAALSTIYYIKKPDFYPKKYKHVLFIVADDLGWSDIGYGLGGAVSPNIDKLAKESVILNSSYTYSVCTPSRNSILTGMFAERTGLQHFAIMAQSPIALPTNFNILPQYLKKYGYSTHGVGKWHLGACNIKYTPAKRGFDSFYGFFGAQTNYYTHRVPYDEKVSGLDFWNQTVDYLEPITNKNNTYSQFLYTERAIDLIGSHDKSKPLFLYFASQSPHTDEAFNVPKEYIDKFKHIENLDRRKILGMVSLLDDSIANLTRALEKNGMLDDTLLVFTSDNGGQILDNARNFPLRGGKTTVFEGGQRVRAFINSKNLKPYTFDGLFHSVDWLPTIISAATGENINLPNIDGVNQWDSIKNNLKSKRDSFIYNIDPFGVVQTTNENAYNCDSATEAIRVEDWKLIRGCAGTYTDWYNLNNFTHEYSRAKGHALSISTKAQNCLNPENPKNSTFSYFLFNIKDDPTERNNLARESPCKIKELEVKLEEYKKLNIEPQLKEPYEDYLDPKSSPALWADKWSPGWC